MNDKNDIKVVAQTDRFQVIAKRSRYGDEGVVYHSMETMSDKARMAAAFVEKWGMVAGRPAGEDKAGRQKLELLTPEEVAKRACETVELLYAEFQAREWIVKVPGYDEMFRDPPPTTSED
jgi:hypothetical protein